MKKISFILLLAITSILYSCKKEKNTFTLGVDIQSSFNQDKVQIFIDGRQLINKRLQTNYVLGVCLAEGQIVTMLSEGKHEIKAIVNNTTHKTEIFSLHNNLYIGINYDQQLSKISFVYANQRFLYD